LSTFKKWLFNILGIIYLLIGIINLFIPVLPTSPFLILASISFARVNPKMKSWLLNNKYLGPYMNVYYNNKGMATAYKIRICTFMWGGMIFAMALIGLLWVYILMAAIGVAITIHILAAKTMQTPTGKYGLNYNLLSILLMLFWFVLAMIFAIKTTLGYLVVGGVGLALTLGVLIYTLLAGREKKA